MTTTISEKTTSTWTLDPDHIEAGFAVRHFMISTVRGRFGAVKGTVTIDEAEPTKSVVDVTIDVSSIDTRQEARDEHLRSADFFDAANYPTIRFVSTAVSGDIASKFTVTGDLTIRGVTRSVTLDATAHGGARDPWGNERLGFEAKGALNRSDFGLNWNRALETGGVAVSDEVKLSIEAELIKQAAQ